MSPATASRPRRTQRERREATIEKLVDATIEAILEVGYADTSVNEICARAGLSHGALFRFFPSVLDLVIAAGQEVARRQLEAFGRRFARLEGHEAPIPAALKLLRDACRAPTNAVLYELVLAARTDAGLRAALAPMMAGYYRAISETASRIPGLEALPADTRELLVFTAVHLLDGESLVRAVLPQPKLEARRLELLAGLVTAMAPTTQVQPGAARATSRTPVAAPP